MASFLFKSKEKIPHASKASELLVDIPPGEGQWPFHSKGHRECWQVVFSPDESRFAWLFDRKKITIVPWNRFKNCPLSQDNTDLEGNKLKGTVITIWTLTPVCSAAFGSGTGNGDISASSEKQWRRFNYNKGMVLATGHLNGRIRIWDADSGQLLLELVDLKCSIKDLAFAPDGSLRLASASMARDLKLWDLKDDGNLFETLKGHTDIIMSCTWSPNAKMLASTGPNKDALIWNTETYKLQCKLDGHHHNVVSCDFSPDSALLATASWDSRVIIWDTYTGSIVRVMCHIYPPPRLIFASGVNGAWVRGVSFCKNGSFLASVADDGFVRMWNLMGDIDPEVIATRDDEMICCRFAPSGRCLAVGSSDGNVTFYSTPKAFPSLLHLSRLTVRKYMKTPEIDEADIPLRLKDYLKYKIWL